MAERPPDTPPIPMIVDSRGHQEFAFDVYSGLLRQRLVFLNGEIDDELAALVIAQLLFLEAEDPEREITLHIASGDGSITAGLSIHDTMEHLSCDVATVAMGMVGSVATLLLAAGTHGKRKALPNVSIHVHSLGGSLHGNLPDVQSHLSHLLSLQERSHRLMAKYTGQPCDRIVEDFQRDRYLTPVEALEYGILDDILVR